MNSRLPSAGLGRRLASLSYESLLLFAIGLFAQCLLIVVVVLLTGISFGVVAEWLLSGWPRHAFQAYLFIVIGAYLAWCWTRAGQTLPMKAWRLKLVRVEGGLVSPAQAILRYMLAWLSLLPLGAGFFWALVDRDGQFLHDRLAKSRVVSAGD